MAWPSTIPTFTPGTPLAAADLNDLRDALKAIGDPWTTYSPTLKAATSDPTMGSSVVVGYYRKLGKTFDVEVGITIGAGWSAGSGNYKISLPAGCSPVLSNPSKALGFGMARRNSPAAARPLHAYWFSSTEFAVVDSTTGTVINNASPFAWTTGDFISVILPAVQVL